MRLQLLEHQLSCIEGESAPPRPAAAGEATGAGGEAAAQDAGAAEDGPAAGAGGGMRNRDRPELARFFKMIQMGVPEAAVKNKMAMEGFDASSLDDPDGVS